MSDDADTIPAPPPSEVDLDCPLCAECELCGGGHHVTSQRFEVWARAMVQREIDAETK